MATSIGQNIIEVIKDKELQKVNSDIIESILDVNLTDGLIKEIPFLSTIFGAYNAVTTIKDKLFIKKLYYFLHELNSVPQENRIQQISKIDDDLKYKTKVGEKLMYIIDKAEDIDKSVLIGKFFKAYLEGNLSYEDFLGGVMCIEKTPLSELLDFINSDWKKRDLGISNGVPSYISYGLTEIFVTTPKIKVEKSRTSFDDKLDYKITDFTAIAIVTKNGNNIRQYLK